ncbi:hypothetical protein KY285_036264 [Solanum tuberosum]|nr:hypothetical protein KY285_036264 [Solanum tuberosum]
MNLRNLIKRRRTPRKIVQKWVSKNPVIVDDAIEDLATNKEGQLVQQDPQHDSASKKGKAKEQHEVDGLSLLEFPLLNPTPTRNFVRIQKHCSDFH